MHKQKTQLANIMKIMTLVLKDMEKKGLPEKGAPSPMIARLVKKGFSFEDIDTAMRWLTMMTAQIPNAQSADAVDTEGGPSSVRHLHASEAIRLTPEAQRFLLNMLEGGQISGLHFERVIEYLWKNDLRDVTASRLELLLYLNDPNPGRGDKPLMSDKVDRPLFIN